MRRYAFVFALRLSALAMVAVGGLHAQDWAGNWQGSFRENGEERRIVLQIAKGDAGAWKVAGCFIEFLHDPAKVVSFALNGDSVQLKVNEARIHGELYQMLTTDQQAKLKEFEANREARMQQRMQNQGAATPEQ